MVKRDAGSELEDRVVEITQAEQKKEKLILKNEDTLRDLWNNVKCTNIWIIGVPEGEKKERGRELIWRINSWKPLNLEKETDIQIKDAQGVPKRNEPKEVHTRTHYN